MLSWSSCEAVDLGFRDWDCKFDEFGVGDWCDGRESRDGIEFPAYDVEDEKC